MIDQVALAGIALTGVATIIAAIALLLKAMTSSYGGVINAMQSQNGGQQAQINQLQKDNIGFIADHKKCQEELLLVKTRLTVLELKTNMGINK